MAGLAQGLRCLLPGLWAGVLLAIATISAPAAFALLSRPDAGRMVGRFFQQEAWLSLVLAVSLMLLERGRARRMAAVGQGSVFSTDLMLLLGTVFCTVAGYFALQPLMAQARDGQGALTFGQLHAISLSFYFLKLLLVLALAWRGASAGNLSRLPSS